MTTINAAQELREQFNDTIHTQETWAAVLSSPKVSSSAGKYQIPDFVSLGRTEFCDAETDCECIGAHCHIKTAPRFAYLLWTNGEFLADAFTEWQFFEDELPPVAMRYLSRLDDVGRTTWLARFSASFLYFSDCAEAGIIPAPRCTGEEMALHILLDFVAGDIQDLDEIFGEDHDFMALPEANRDLGEDLSIARDCWFEDEDVLMLFSPSFDGIESDTEVTAVMGIANLHPNSWFLPFRS